MGDILWQSVILVLISPEQARGLLGAGGGLAAFLLLVSLLGFLQTIFPLGVRSRLTPADLGLPFQEIRFTTEDGVSIAGWWIPHALASEIPTVVLLHGHPADKGNILPAMRFLASDFNLLLFDFRGLGQSGGRISTAGAREVEDLRAALRFLRARGIERVGVWGFSLGGAVALMAAPQSSEIAAIVAESSYARLDLLAPQLYPIPLLRHPLGWLTVLWAKLVLGIDAREIAPVEAVDRIAAPVLLIHSRSDHVIGFRHAQMLQDALRGNVVAEFWFPEDLRHGQLSEEHERRVTDFFLKHLSAR